MCINGPRCFFNVTLIWQMDRNDPWSRWSLEEEGQMAVNCEQGWLSACQLKQTTTHWQWEASSRPFPSRTAPKITPADSFLISTQPPLGSRGSRNTVGRRDFQNSSHVLAFERNCEIWERFVDQLRVIWWLAPACVHWSKNSAAKT